MNLHRIVPLAVCLLFSACQPKDDGIPATEQGQKTAPTATGAAAIDADSFSRRVRTLSSDEFEGREPFTAGETKTIEFIRDEFRRAGAIPGNNGEWYQEVPLVEITATGAQLSVGGRGPLKLGTDAVMWTKRVTTEPIEVNNSEMVFVGYGIVAPEYDWNDYEGLDAQGKTVVMLVNDPGYASKDDSLFNGNAMTYYGRWSYKFEEAARQGAAAVLIVHETGPAGYPFSVISNGWDGPRFDLVTADKNLSRPKIEGWINSTTANELLTTIGMTLDEARDAALQSDFRPLPMALTMSGKLRNSIRESVSYNVLGVVPGTDLADEYIIYMAHWDHLGRNTTLEGDQIFNGAVDNATGTSALMELAEAFATQKPRPRRSILLVAVTAEESGLLGSRHYGTNPVYPLAKTVGGINMDGLNVHGRTRDIAVIGFGSSQMEQYLTRAARQQDRVTVPEPTPEKGFFYRSDHFNLAKQGVPVIYAKSGFEYREGGAARGAEIAKDWVANRYHKVGDEFNADWDLSGAIEDIQIYYMIGNELASGDDWPAWYPTSEFKAIRDASLAN